VALLFPGQGSQYINMGLQLYRGEPVYREAVDRCATLLAPHLGLDLRSFLFPAPGDETTATESLNNTFYTQPAIFTVSYSLATLLNHLGIAPSRLLGHSIGEFVAATMADVMDLEAALALVATRGRLMQSLPKGSMLSVRLPAEEVEPRLPAGVDIAAINGPKLCVVAGPTPVLTEWSEALGKENIVTRMLHTSHAFHSSMMDPVVEPFLRAVERVGLRAPRLPIASTVTGEWMKPSDAMDPKYWARHLRSTVRYAKAVQLLLDDSSNVLIECGPRRTCQALALQQRPKNPARVLATMPDSGELEQETASFLLALGQLWMQGCDLDVARLHGGESRRRVPLPTYAFQRKRFWIDAGVVSASPAVVAPTATAEPVASEAPSADALLGSVFSLVEELLGAPVESRDPDARFMALGLDSLLLTQMARAIRQRMGFEVTFRELTQKISSPRLLAEAVRAAGAAPAPSVFPAPRPAALPATPVAVPAASTDVEATLFALVEELLGAPLDARDPDARFMALGLDSLLLTQMARAVRQRLGFEVTFRELTQKYSSPRLLTAAIEQKRAPVAAAPVVSPTSTGPVPAADKTAPAVKDHRNARLGRDAHGRPAWFAPDPNRPGKFIQVTNP
jgi:acyl transferase domain-containing protein